jgi:hypothetical protein
MLLSHDLHVLTGAYALDALDDGAERDRFVRHLRRCQACASEVRGLREVATALAYAAAAEPPPELRERIMRLVRTTRQLPPEVGPERLLRRLRAWLSSAGWTIWFPRLATVTAVVAVVVAIVLGISLAGTQQQLSQAQAQSRAIAAVLAAPDVRTVTGPVKTGGVATVVLSAARHQLVVSTSGLRALPADRVYQLWLIGPPAVRSAGLLPSAVAGRTSPVLASGMVAGDKLGVTVEPAGGTSRPTTKPILVLSLPA